MGLFRFLFKWSLQITGAAMVGYNYGLKIEQQADLYGFYRSCFNSYRAIRQIHTITNEYKQLASLKTNSEEYNRQLGQVNNNTAKRIEELSRANKGVYMRLGQYLGHLKFAFPSQFSNVLSDLNQRPNYQPQDYKYLKKHIESRIGKKTKDLFQTLNTSPISSDLFSSIYKGELVENFLDVNLKVIYPYAKSEAKWDFWFLNKAMLYINDFKKKHFSEADPLFLDLLYNNLKLSVQKELNFTQQQAEILSLKQKINKVSTQQASSKAGVRALPFYVPYIYSQYTKENIMIQQYFQGNHLSNVDSILKENYNLKSISNDLINLWNGLLQNEKLLIESYAPSEIVIRASRVNEEGPYQICPVNLSKVTTVPEFLVTPYTLLWKELISGKKIDPKKPQQRIKSVRSFYEDLPQVYFSLFLNDKQSLTKLAEKANLATISSLQNQQLLKYSKSKLSAGISKKMDQKKILPLFKSKPVLTSQVEQSYKQLRSAFQIQYQPWKLQIIYNTYKQAFKQEKHFGEL